MKQVTTAALAAVLLATTAPGAQAQDSGREYVRPGVTRQQVESWRSGAPQSQAQAQAEAQPQPQREGRGGRGDGARQDATPRAEATQHPHADAQREGRRSWREDRRGGDADHHRRWEERRGDRDDRRWEDRRRDGDWERRREWSGREWQDGHGRQARPRYDRRYYPPVFRPARRYRVPIYRPPIGFYSRSWVYGDTLPYGWYGPQYRILDWWSYGLPIPPVGFEWVRIGDDAVLVDEFTGRIVQVVRNLFW